METLRALGFTAGPLLGGLLGAAGLLQLALVIDALVVRRGRPRRARAAGAAPAGDDTRARAGARGLRRSSARDRALAITLGGAVAALTGLHHVRDRGAVLRDGRASAPAAPATAC
jgi:hypothetical protein